MKISEVEQLILAYGANTTLQMIKNGIINRLPYECPKCSGLGYKWVEYDAYPPGLPDSGWATDIRRKQVDCTVCNGQGRTANKMKAITKITGYEEE